MLGGHSLDGLFAVQDETKQGAKKVFDVCGRYWLLHSTLDVLGTKMSQLAWKGSAKT